MSSHVDVELETLSTLDKTPPTSISLKRYELARFGREPPGNKAITPQTRNAPIRIWQHVNSAVHSERSRLSLIYVLLVIKATREGLVPIFPPVVLCVFLALCRQPESALARGLFGNVVGPVKEFTD